MKVKELIELLKLCNQEATVCIGKIDIEFSDVSPDRGVVDLAYVKQEIPGKKKSTFNGS